MEIELDLVINQFFVKIIGPKDLLKLKNQFQDWNKVCIKNEK